MTRLSVVAATAVLPAPGETVMLLGHGRGNPIAVPAFAQDPRALLPTRLRHRVDRFTAVACLAVSQALVDADHDPAAGPRTGVFLANTRAGWHYGETGLAALTDRGPGALPTYQATAWFPAAAQGEVTIGLGLQGPAKTTAGTTPGFAEALWLARDAIEHGTADTVVVGAAESLVSHFAASPHLSTCTGAAEGAVALVLRPAEAGRAELSDLRLDPDDLGATGDEWAPSLAAAVRLFKAVTGQPAGTTCELPVGGGYRLTVTTPQPQGATL